MSLSGNRLHVLHADALQLVRYEVGGLLHVGLVLIQRADAGNAKEIFQFGQESLLVLAGIIDCRGCHKMTLSRAYGLDF